MTVQQMRAVLDYLGVPYDQQPKKLGELKFVLKQYENVNNAEYLKAVSVIVDGVRDNTEVPNKYKDTEDFIEQRFKKYENDTVKHFIERIAQDIQSANKNYTTNIELLKEEAQSVWREEMAKHRKIIVEHKPEGKRVELDVKVPAVFEDMIDLAMERENIMLVGPAGAGKTFLAGQLAKALDMPFASQSCSAGISESVFAGWLLPTGENAKFNHVTSPFVQLYENGGVFLFDEMDAADPNVLTFLNQALANGSFYLPQRFDKPLVEKHPDFVAIAATNTYGKGADSMYHARNALDEATLDRFRMGMLAVYYDKHIEQNLAHEDITAWGWEVRKVIENHNLKRVMSTRVLIAASKMYVNREWPLFKIAGKYFQDWSAEEKRLMQNQGVTTGD